MSREQRRDQKGHLYRRGDSWFVRYYDDILQTDGTVKRTQVSKKLEVTFGDQYRTKKSVRPFAAEILAPLNRGVVTVQEGTSAENRRAPARVHIEGLSRRLAVAPERPHRKHDSTGISHG